MNILTANKKQKKQFRVKFSTADLQRRNTNTKYYYANSSVAKEVILRSRTRQKSLRSSFNFNVDQQMSLRSLTNDSEPDSVTSKKELKIISPIIINYATITTSAIVNDMCIIQNFFTDAVNFKLIFRASHHGFSVNQFHSKCDQYQNTLVICLTEDNKIIGGYTPLKWEEEYQQNSTYFKTDFKRETFLFSVSDNCKYPLVKSLKNKAICCFKSYGPTFGGGYDLLIGDKANELPNTASYFPRNFEHPKGANYNKRQFTGTSRKNFKLQEWQVFHVTKQYNFLKTMQTENFDPLPAKKQKKRQKSCLDKLKIVAKDIIANLCSDN